MTEAVHASLRTAAASPTRIASRLSMAARRRKRIDPAAVRAARGADPAGLLQRRVLHQRARRARRGTRRSVTWQLRQASGWLGGIDEAVALLKLCSDDFAALDVHALYEGDRFEPWDTVLVVEGDYAASPISRRSSSARWLGARGSAPTAQRIVDAARPKPVFYFGARDHVLLPARRRLQRARRRSEVRLHRRAGGAVRQAGCGHHPARADRGVRRRHGRGDRAVAAGCSRECRRSSPSWITRTTAWRRALAVAQRARGAPVGRAARHGRSSMVDLDPAADGRVPADRREPASSCGTCATRSTPRDSAT